MDINHITLANKDPCTLNVFHFSYNVHRITPHRLEDIEFITFCIFFFNCCKKKKELNIFLYGKHYGYCYLNYHLPRNKGKNMTKQEGANV